MRKAALAAVVDDMPLRACLVDVFKQMRDTEEHAIQRVAASNELQNIMFAECRICLRGSLDPERMQSLCDILQAVCDLVVSHVWEMNRAAIQQLPPYCNKCGGYGHDARNCVHFMGQSREASNMSFAFAPEHDARI